MTKRKRVQQEQVLEQLKPQREEKKAASITTATGKGKASETEPATTEKEESPDMVDEILGRRTGSKQAKKETAKMHTEEENRNTKQAQSGNTKEKHTQETAKKEERKRVPPPASARERVDESKIDEVAVARLKAARLKQIIQTGKDNTQMRTEPEVETGKENTQMRTGDDSTSATRREGETITILRSEGEDTPHTR